MNKKIFLLLILSYIVFVFSIEKVIEKAVNTRNLQMADPMGGLGGNTSEEVGGETGKEEGGETGKEEGGETGKEEEEETGKEEEETGKEEEETGKEEEEEETEEENLSYKCSEQEDKNACLILELNVTDYYCCYITYNYSNEEYRECILNSDKELYFESDDISSIEIDCYSWKLMSSLFLILLSLVIF